MRPQLRLLPLAGLLILAGCNYPPSTQAVTGPAVMYTYAAQTVQAQGTLSLSTPAPTMTYNGPVITLPASGATPIPTATLTPQPINSPNCNAAHFVSDVSVPDDSAVKPGQVFVKTWRITNNGVCTWDAGYALVFVNGDALGAPGHLPLGSPVSPGMTVDISVQMVSPLTPGSYQGDWMLQDTSGTRFGFGMDSQESVWVRIQVVP